MEPMKLEVYNSIVADFEKSFGIQLNYEQELKKKYKNIPPVTLGSIMSSLVQRAMKYNYRKSTSISQKYYQQFQEHLKTNTEENSIVHLANEHAITPSLYARSLLQHVYSDSDVKEVIKDTSLIQDPSLAYQTFMANLSDNHYGPYADVIKRSLGLEYEVKLERELKLLKIPYTTESILRSNGFEKTPDIKLDVPIAVDGFVVNWIESKALFGNMENHNEYLKKQYICYWNRFGPGLIIYWFGYLETLECTTECNNIFIIRSSFPKRENLILHKSEFK